MNPVIRTVAVVAFVLCSCIAIVPSLGETDAEPTELLENGGTLTINLYEVTSVTCAVSPGAFPEIVSADVPQWCHYITPANLRIFMECIPTETGTFEVSFDYYPSSDDRSQQYTWGATIIVADPNNVGSSQTDHDACPIDVDYSYNGKQLVIYFDGVDKSAVSDPYFYIAVYTGDLESCDYYLSPGYNVSYTVNNLEDGLQRFIVYLCDGLPGDFSASTIVTSADCIGSKVVSSPTKDPASDAGSDQPQGDVSGIDGVVEDPSILLSYGIVAIAALFVISIVFGRRSR